MTLLLLVAAKGTLVLTLGALAARVLRRRPASARHAVWAATFAALLLVPALGALGPVWTVAVLPAHAEEVAAPAALPLAAPADVLPAAVPVAATSVGLWDWIAGFLAGVWSLGAVVVASVWLRAFSLARRLVRDAEPVTGSGRAKLVERARVQSGVGGSVRVLRSDVLRVPVAWGYGRPTVVLPRCADGWDAERLEAVLLHEMAHLRRGDAWTQAVAQAALVLHWPNPLAWAFYRRLLEAREQACDDAVLRAGARPADYAAHLVAVAREMTARLERPARLALAAVAPMAARCELDGRVRSVLDGERRRAPLGRRSLGATLALTVAVGAPLAAFQPVPAATARVEEGDGARRIARHASADTLDVRHVSSRDPQSAEETRQRPERSAPQRERVARPEDQKVRRNTSLAEQTAEAEARNAEAEVRNAETAVRNAEREARNAATEVRNAATEARNAETAVRNAETAVRNAETAVRIARTEALNALGRPPAASSSRSPRSASHP